MKLSRTIISLCCVGLLASASALRADTMTFEAKGNANGGDGPIDAMAVITTSANQITVTLTNLLNANSIVDVGEAIADISFVVSCDPGTKGTAIAVGQEGDVSNGKVDYTVGSGEPTSPGRFIGVGGGAYTVNDSTDKITLEAIGGGQPDELILPYLANGSTYADLNNGASSHNPYTIGPATFTLNFTGSGITANTTISDVMISFGTSPDTFKSAPQIPNVTPEPSSLLLLGTGILGAAGLLRRRLVSNLS